jgi:hypothetical protein
LGKFIVIHNFIILFKNFKFNFKRKLFQPNPKYYEKYNRNVKGVDQVKNLDDFTIKTVKNDDKIETEQKFDSVKIVHEHKNGVDNETFNEYF